MVSEQQLRELARRVVGRVLSERGRETRPALSPAREGLERMAGVHVRVEGEQGAPRPCTPDEADEPARKPSREVLTVESLRTVEPGARLQILHDTIVTDLALEEARRKDIRLSYGANAAEAVGGDARLRVAIGSDHGGFTLKQAVIEWVRALGHVAVDLGTTDENPVDYPDFAAAVAEAVVAGRAEFGICVDAAGIGSAMAANKVPGALAAMCYDTATARNAREHNHANVLTLGARMIGLGVAQDIVRTFLSTAAGGERHARRVQKIHQIQRRHNHASPPPTRGVGGTNA